MCKFSASSAAAGAVKSSKSNENATTTGSKKNVGAAGRKPPLNGVSSTSSRSRDPSASSNASSRPPSRPGTTSSNKTAAAPVGQCMRSFSVFWTVESGSRSCACHRHTIIVLLAKFCKQQCFQVALKWCSSISEDSWYVMQMGPVNMCGLPEWWFWLQFGFLY